MEFSSDKLDNSVMPVKIILFSVQLQSGTPLFTCVALLKK